MLDMTCIWADLHSCFMWVQSLISGPVSLSGSISRALEPVGSRSTGSEPEYISRVVSVFFRHFNPILSHQPGLVDISIVWRGRYSITYMLYMYVCISGLTE